METTTSTTTELNIEKILETINISSDILSYNASIIDSIQQNSGIVIYSYNNIIIASNISEGTSRTSNKDQTHFTQIAYSSLMEVICQLIISKDLGFISENVYLSLRKKAEKISNKLNSLRKSQLNK